MKSSEVIKYKHTPTRLPGSARLLKEKDYPVKGTIVNSNPYIKTNEMDSFIIPEVKKEDIKPTFWQKTKKSAKNVVKTGKWVIIGVGVGLLISVL
jgi:hypothetical protein